MTKVNLTFTMATFGNYMSNEKVNVSKTDLSSQSNYILMVKMSCL